jgi:hypothetical protein
MSCACALVVATRAFVANGGVRASPAVGVLHRRGGRAASAVSVSAGWWCSNSQLSPPRRKTSEFSGGCGALAPLARRLVLVPSISATHACERLRNPLAKQLGHSLAVLLSTYAHLIDEYADRQPIDAEAEIAEARKARVLRVCRRPH